MAIEGNQYGQKDQLDSITGHDDIGFSIAMVLVDQRRAREERIAITSLNNEEDGEGIMDTTVSPTITTTTAAFVITTVSTTTAPSAPSAPFAPMNTIEMARATINRCGIGAIPTVGQTPSR